MSRTSAGLCALFVAGFVLFAYGFTYPTTNGQLGDVRTEASVVEGTAAVISYDELPRSVQEDFDRAIETESSASLEAVRSAIDADYVRYDGRYYRVGGLEHGPGDSFEYSLGLLGLVIASLSTVIYLLVRRESTAAG